MRPSYNRPDRQRVLFDDPRLIADAGLLLPATLAARLAIPASALTPRPLTDLPVLLSPSVQGPGADTFRQRGVALGSAVPSPLQPPAVRRTTVSASER